MFCTGTQLSSSIGNKKNPSIGKSLSSTGLSLSSRMALLWYWLILCRVYILSIENSIHLGFLEIGFSDSLSHRFKFPSFLHVLSLYLDFVPEVPSDSGDSLCLICSVSPIFLWNPELTSSLRSPELTLNLGFQFLFSYTSQSWLPVSVSFYWEVEADLFTLIITSYGFQIKCDIITINF